MVCCFRGPRDGELRETLPLGRKNRGTVAEKGAQKKARQPAPFELQSGTPSSERFRGQRPEIPCGSCPPGHAPLRIPARRVAERPLPGKAREQRHLQTPPFARSGPL